VFTVGQDTVARVVISAFARNGTKILRSSSPYPRLHMKHSFTTKYAPLILSSLLLSHLFLNTLSRVLYTLFAKRN
jgi:hypothetical protein